MPLYEYRCSKGHRFERLERLGEDGPKRCERRDCRSRSFERLLSSGVAIRFRGSGFHNTDYKSKPPED